MSAKLSPSLGASACERGYSDTLRGQRGASRPPSRTTPAPTARPTTCSRRSPPRPRATSSWSSRWRESCPDPKPKDSVARSGPPGVGQAPRAAGGHAHGAPRRRTRQPTVAPADNELDISATLFSVAQGALGRDSTMQYSGASVDDAMAKFAARLAEALPQARARAGTGPRRSTRNISVRSSTNRIDRGAAPRPHGAGYVTPRESFQKKWPEEIPDHRLHRFSGPGRHPVGRLGDRIAVALDREDDPSWPRSDRADRQSGSAAAARGT